MVVAVLTLMTGLAFAQPGPPPNGGPGGPGRPGGPGGPTAAATNGSTLLITRMLQFDKNADEQLTLEEVTDARLHRLFRRADADQDGTVTKAELTALAAAITAEFPNAGQRGGPGGPGGPRGGGPGGPPPGGPGGFGAPPPGGPPPRRPQ